MNPKQAANFYVYALVDPRDESVFYIGKGKGRRAYTHAQQGSRGAHPNPLVQERISSINGDGRQTRALIVWSGLSHDEAIRRECALISRIGVERLTNISPGALSWPQSQMARARALLSRLPTGFPDDLRWLVAEMAHGRQLRPLYVQSGDLPLVQSYWDGSWLNHA